MRRYFDLRYADALMDETVRESMVSISFEVQNTLDREEIEEEHIGVIAYMAQADAYRTTGVLV